MRRPVLIAVVLVAIALLVAILSRRTSTSPTAEAESARPPSGSSPLSSLNATPSQPGKSGNVKEAGPRSLTRRKLNQLIIPSIDVQNASLDDVVKLLRNESLGLDPESNPLKKGFNYTIRHRPQISIGSDDQQPEPRITWKAEDVSIFRALEEVARQTNMKVIVDDPVVIIFPDPDLPDPKVPKS